MTSTLLSLLVGGGVAVCPAPAAPAGADAQPNRPPDLEALYRGGRTFEHFLAAADRRKAMWDDHYENGGVDPDAVERAAAIPGTWRILAVAEDWCSDSVSTIPFLALLAERAEGLELRVIDSEAGREIMEAHRTPDGRAATPTVLILDEAYEQVGCWVERPTSLQAWALENRPSWSDREFLARKMAWYEEDGGRSTVREIVELIERASRGEEACSAGP